MGKSKPKMEVTEYYMSLHFGICNGPVDALLGLTVKEKSAWSGVQTDPGNVAINKTDFFGGVKKEGGLKGVVAYLPGRSDQVLSDSLAVKLGRSSGADCPGFRGLASLFFTGTSGTTTPHVAWSLPGASTGGAGFYWTANSPYLPGVWATVRRAPVGLDPDYALIPQGDPTVTEYDDMWRYKVVPAADGGAAGVPSAYISPSYDDSAWPIGQGSFGDGTALDPATGIHYFANTYVPAGEAGKGIWIRKDFDFAAPDEVGSITLDLWHDDGVWAWWNGTPLTTASASSFHATATIANDAILASNTLVVQVLDSVPSGSPTHIHAGVTVTVNANPMYDANPSHMIYECLTSTDWGMGAPSTIIDVDSFEAAAVALYGEKFGLSMMWTRQAAIEDFVSEILDHIQAVLYVDPATGLLTLKLIRDDYDPDTLPELNPDNCDVTKFDRKLWGEVINEIIVTWTNPENEQDETVIAQDLASIAMQGGNIVSASRNYYGVRTASLATKLARRDLRTVGAPLASCEVEIDRSAYAIRPAACYKLTWPEHGLNGAVMRVMSVDSGRPGDMTIRAVLMEDFFSLDAGAYVEPVGSGWEDPSSAPEPITEARVITLPTFLAAEAVAQVGGSEPVYSEVVAGILATSDNTDTFAYDLYTQLTLPDGSLQWSSVGTNNIVGRGALAADLVAEAATTGITLTDFTGQTPPSQGGFALIGATSDDETVMEVAMVTAVDTGTGEISLARGVMDTVPRTWEAGTHIWFVDGETLFEDRQVRSAGETVEYKLLSQTSQGQLDISGAPTLSGTMSERPWLPLRPANVTAYGEAWSSETAMIDATERVDPWITVSWSNRNRLTEDSQILLWTDATVTPEAGQTTTVEVLALDDTLLATHDGLTGDSFDVPDASFGGESFVELRVYSERTDADGDFVSLQSFSHWLMVGGGVRITETDDQRISEGGDVRTMED